MQQLAFGRRWGAALHLGAMRLPLRQLRHFCSLWRPQPQRHERVGFLQGSAGALFVSTWGGQECGETSQHTHKCAQAPVQLLPPGAPAAEEPLSTPHLLLADLQRLAHLAARIAQLAKLLVQSADRVGACAHSIGLGCSSVGSLS